MDNLIHFPVSSPTNLQELHAAIRTHCEDIYYGATHPERGAELIMTLIKEWLDHSNQR